MFSSSFNVTSRMQILIDGYLHERRKLWQVDRVEVTVSSKSRSRGRTWRVSFISNPKGNIPQMVIDAQKLRATGYNQSDIRSGGAGYWQYDGFNASVTTLNEGSALGGTFTISYGTHGRTRDLPFNASAALVASALSQVPGVGSPSVSRSIVDEFANAFNWSITFTNSLLPIHLLSVDSSLLTGTGISTSIRRNQAALNLSGFST